MSWSDVLKNFLKEWSGLIVGLVFFVGGIVCYCIWREGLIHSFSETAIIAGLVTFTVDPFVKKRIVREASKDIFGYIVGMDLPNEVRDALNRQLFSTESYREDVHIVANVESDGAGVLLTVEQSGKVVAAKHCVYRQKLQFEESEQGEILHASVSGHHNPDFDYEKTAAQDLALQPTEEAMVLEWAAHRDIPLRKGEKINTRIKFQVSGERFDYFSLNFSAPVVRPTLRVSCSSDLVVEASTGSRRIGNQYTYDKVFLYADHLNIRWKSKPHAERQMQ